MRFDSVRYLGVCLFSLEKMRQITFSEVTAGHQIKRFEDVVSKVCGYLALDISSLNIVFGNSSLVRFYDPRCLPRYPDGRVLRHGRMT